MSKVRQVKEAGARLRFRLGEKFLKTVKIKVSRGNDTTPRPLHSRVRATR